MAFKSKKYISSPIKSSLLSPARYDSYMLSPLLQKTFFFLSFPFLLNLGQGLCVTRQKSYGGVVLLALAHPLFRWGLIKESGE